MKGGVQGEWCPGGSTVLIRGSPAGGNSVESSVVHAPEDVSIFEDFRRFSLPASTEWPPCLS
jgi:hypothetical protein